MKGMGEEKLYIPLLTSGKRQKAPLGRSDSTHFVADCSFASRGCLWLVIVVNFFFSRVRSIWEVMVPGVSSWDRGNWGELRRDQQHTKIFQSAMYVLWRQLRKDWCEKCRAFPGQVSLRILSLESIDFFGTSEYSSAKKKNLNEQNFMVGCCKLSLYTKWVLWKACDLFSAMIEITRQVHHVLVLW